MRILIPFIFFTALILLLPHGTLETLAVIIGAVVTSVIAFRQIFRKPRRRPPQPRPVQTHVTQPRGVRVPARLRPTASIPAAPRRQPPAQSQSRPQMIEVIYIGERFYQESHTEMGSLYEIDSRGNWERHTLGTILLPLEHGAIVGLRKANAQELAQAERMLANTLRTQQLRRQGDW